MKKLILSALSDPIQGDVSIKRLIGTLSFVTLVILALLDTCLQYHSKGGVTQFIFEAFEYIIFATFFGTIVEKFTKKFGA